MKNLGIENYSTLRSKLKKYDNEVGFFFCRVHKTAIDKQICFLGLVQRLISLSLFTIADFSTEHICVFFITLLTSWCVSLSHEIFQCPSLMQWAGPSFTNHCLSLQIIQPSRIQNIQFCNSSLKHQWHSI